MESGREGYSVGTPFNPLRESGVEGLEEGED